LLNAVGYDDEASGQQMHPVRIKVRQMVKNNLAKTPEKVSAWRKYYKGKSLAIYQYQDFVLSLSADYPFKPLRPESELTYPQTARLLKDFPEVLNDFWTAAELTKVWSEVKPDYLAELKQYDFEKMKRQLSFLWEYLRMKRRDTYVLVNIPNLLDTHYQAIAAQRGNYYYSVESPGSHSYALNIHEYLHSIVNPLVKANYDAHKSKLQRYYQIGKGGPLTKSYQEPVTFTYECLVRALDHRLRVKLEENATKRIEDRVASLTGQGLTLTQPFYLLLAEYEKSGQRFDEFLPVLLERLPNKS